MNTKPLRNQKSLMTLLTRILNDMQFYNLLIISMLENGLK